jgi:DNA-binding CsgD family transcriptional regulator
LPGPRRHALEVALLLAEPDERADPRTLPVAVRSALLALAEDAPVLLAVDDVQWLDPSSAAALAFAVRRLEGEPVRVLLARRVEEGVEPPELERALPGERTERVGVGPLSLGATQRLLQERLGRAFPRPVLVRVHEASGGNPFYAQELARALPGDVDPTRPLPVPVTLEGLVRARLAGLPEETREALAVAAALGRVEVGLLERAGVQEDALEPAERAHVIARENGHVRFTHPLLASVLERQQSAAARRALHARLAEVVGDPLGRARHLALAAGAPNTEVAAELDDAASFAGARGAALAAAELAEHALRLTPPRAEDDVHRRTLAAARAHLGAGDFGRAADLARDLHERSEGRRRAEALLQLADAEENDATAAEWLSRFREALAELDGEPALQARIHARLAFQSAHAVEGVHGAEPHARAAVELARGLDDEQVCIEALGALAAIRHWSGDPDADELAAEAWERARRSGDEHAALLTRMNLSYQFFQSGSLDEARDLLRELEDDWGRRSEWANGHICAFRAITELYAGDLRTGAPYAERHLKFVEEWGVMGPMWFVAAYPVHGGDQERARALLERDLAMPPSKRGAPAALAGCMELWSGEPQSAAEHFATAQQARVVSGTREPYSWWRAEHAETLLELGRIDEAVDLLDSWEAEAARLGRERALAKILRCRGLVAAARGEVAEALLLLDEAARSHGRFDEGYDRGRALLALGILRRRARQKRAARETIEAALAEFEACGSDLFAGKARAELGSIGGRTREEGLTAAERRVAALVAEGKTNREAAAALFLSERTVASHLSHAYAKLGVRSRTELARVLPR